MRWLNKFLGVLLVWGICQAAMAQQIEVSADGNGVITLYVNQDSADINIDKTVKAMPYPTAGWQDLLEAEMGLSAKDYKASLHRLMQAQANFERERNETGLCLTYFKLGVLYEHWSVYERAVAYYDMAENLAKNLPLPQAYFQSIWLRQAHSHQKIRQTDAAVESFNKLYANYKKQGNVEGIRLILNNLGLLYQQQSQYAKAQVIYQELLALEEKNGDLAKVALLENNLGFTFKKLNKWTDAQRHFQKSITILEKQEGSSQELIAAYINLGSIYNQLKAFDEAISLLKSAVLVAKKEKSKVSIADIENIIAITYLNKGAFNRGMNVVDSAIVIAKSIKNRDVLVRCYRTKAMLFDNLLNYREGSKYHQIYAELKDSIRYEERIEEQTALIQNLNVERLEKELRLLITDTEKNQLVLKQSALEAEREIRQKEMMLLQREKDVQDYTYKSQALELERIKIRKRELEASNAVKINELERKESEIKLNQYRKKVDERNHLTSIRLLAKDKILLEQQRNAQQQSIVGQKEREKLMFGLIILAIVAIGATYAGLSRVKTANLKLRVQQDEVVQQKDSIERMFNLLETKNRHITDSIKYARRIQTVIVPGPEILSQVFPLAFVILRPRDVVSGDVYYLHSTDRYSILASIDCTGHGVPGAMLSVIGYQTLDNIVKTDTDLMPHKILHHLDETLASLLRIDQTDLQQGMDMGLVVIDKKDHVMHYSGAVHNLLYITNGELHEVRASRCSIGGLVPREEKVYETFSISIKEPIYAYLASDGLPTQLGGPQGKKFGSQRLKDMFLSFNGLGASAKKAAIEKAADEWMGTEYKQLDDILVLGFRPDLVV